MYDDDDWDSDSGLDFEDERNWTTTIISHGSVKEIFCPRQRISVNILKHAWHAS